MGWRMKIIINYDLIDKAQESKTGFSLNKYKRSVGICTGIISGATSVTVFTGAQSMFEYLAHCGYAFAYYLLYFRFSQLASKESNISNSEKCLGELVSKLDKIFVRTDVELLQDAYCYETEYEINNSFLPRVMQKKYINVPVYNDWDNNERSLVQEHIIGSKEYFLSYGEPEKKVLKLGQKQFARK